MEFKSAPKTSVPSKQKICNSTPTSAHLAPLRTTTRAELPRSGARRRIPCVRDLAVSDGGDDVPRVCSRLPGVKCRDSGPFQPRSLATGCPRRKFSGIQQVLPGHRTIESGIEAIWGTKLAFQEPYRRPVYDSTDPVNLPKKEKFYSQPSRVADEIPKGDIRIFTGNFNAE
ncbi:hypothetical protein pipiens_008212 [Culex pipiens pipiens]|uniref:Uncharacterized protein n=1 Tax=Culex pipiens pipiens TaxID=38569 RepID=A0ABD1DIS3_CULPP